jgi:hypothetical protein
MASPILWITLAVLILAVYIWSATSTAKETVIVQTSLASFTPDLLNEKNPILIEDRVVDLYQFINAAFKWVFIKEIKSSGSDGSPSNPFSYLVLHSNSETDTHIYICRPGGSDVEMIIPAYTIFILPTGWRWSIKIQNAITILGINTLFGQLGVGALVSILR